MNGVNRIRLLSEEEVFGWTEEDEKIVSVLKKSKINGDYRGDKLEVFEKYGTKTDITDMVYLTGGSKEDKGVVLNSKAVKRWQSTWTNTAEANGRGRRQISESDATGIIRPVLEDPELIYEFVGVDGNIPEEIQYGEYPQMVVNQETQELLTQAMDQKELLETETKYTFNKYSNSAGNSFWDEVYKVYEYQGRKFICMNVKDNIHDYTLSDGKTYIGYDTAESKMWVEVLPIIWIYDKEHNIFISKLGLASGIKRNDIPSFLGIMQKEILQSTRRVENERSI